MTSPDPSGSARPGRVAGLALLGIAAIALVIGLITVLGGGDGQADGQRPDQSDEQQTTSPRPRPPSSTTRSPTSTPPTTTTTTRPPSSTTPPKSTPPGGDNNGEPQKSVPVRVLNNSTIKGLAARAANDLRAAGWNVVEVGNFPGQIPTTTVYFRPDTDEVGPARALAAEFGMRVEPRFDGIANAKPGVIVIVTQDYASVNGK